MVVTFHLQNVFKFYFPPLTSPLLCEEISWTCYDQISGSAIDPGQGLAERKRFQFQIFFLTEFSTVTLSHTETGNIMYKCTHIHGGVLGGVFSCLVNCHWYALDYILLISSPRPCIFFLLDSPRC